MWWSDQSIEGVQSDYTDPCRNTAAVVGAVCIVRGLLREVRTLANGVFTYFLAPRGIGRTKLLYYGSWAGEFSN